MLVAAAAATLPLYCLVYAPVELPLPRVVVNAPLRVRFDILYARCMYTCFIAAAAAATLSLYCLVYALVELPLPRVVVNAPLRVRFDTPYVRCMYTYTQAKLQNIPSLGLTVKALQCDPRLVCHACIVHRAPAPCLAVVVRFDSSGGFIEHYLLCAHSGQTLGPLLLFLTVQMSKAHAITVPPQKCES